MRPMDLEGLKEVFRDRRLHIALGKVTKVGVAQDRSVVRVWVKVFPEEREIITRASWDSVGPEAGVFMLPSINDLVLVGFVEGDDDQAYLLRRLTSREDKVPLQALDGSLVLRALADKKAWLTSDTKVLLSRSDAEPSENLVLGQVFKTMMSTLLEALSVHKHIGNMGYFTAPPDNAQVYSDLKDDPVDNEAVLSDLSFTEK